MSTNNGTDKTTITVTVRDAGGNPLPGMTVSLDAAGDGSVISAGEHASKRRVARVHATTTAIETPRSTGGGTRTPSRSTDTATVNFVFNDVTAPTNTITLGSAPARLPDRDNALLRPAAGGSFTLSSAVADGGSGPGSATYPGDRLRPGWTTALETVNTPAGGPYVSSAFS